jgi:hypothetical protein
MAESTPRPRRSRRDDGLVEEFRVVQPPDRPVGRFSPLHRLRLEWYLRGPDLVVQFVMRADHEGVLEGWDVGYHCVFDPGYATEMESCDLLPGGRCWYDGTSLGAKDLQAKMSREGETVVWDELREWYDDVFERAAEPMLPKLEGLR